MSPTIGPLSIGDLEGGPVEIRKDQFVISVDYATEVDGKRRFNVYAMHIDFDFAKRAAKFAGPILKMLNEVVPL